MGILLILAIISATGSALVTIIAFSVLARPLDLMLTAFNRTMADFTGQTGRAWTSFNSTQGMVRATWFPIAALLLIFAFVFAWMNAQRTEYVTGRL